MKPKPKKKASKIMKCRRCNGNAMPHMAYCPKCIGIIKREMAESGYLTEVPKEPVLEDETKIEEIDDSHKGRRL